MNRVVREFRRFQRVVASVGVPDRSLTAVSGMAAITELCDRLGVVRLLDAAIGPIKRRRRGRTGGGLLLGLAAAQLAGESFLVGLDRQRADAVGQLLAPVPGLASTTAAGLAQRLSDGQWRAVETGMAAIHEAMLAALPGERVARLTETATIDLDTTDVEVYGRKKRGVAFNYQGQRCGRPHVASWAETSTVLAADLMAGNEDPRSHAGELLARALAGLPAAVRTAGRVRLRADAGYFAGELTRCALLLGVEYAIGAKRIAPLWRLLSGVAQDDWTDAIDMPGAQVAVAAYCPDWWPVNNQLLIRRVRLTPDQISHDPRSRRRRTLHPDQRTLPLDELAQADAVYAYSFIVTNLDVCTPAKATEVEHWYRHRTSIENIFRDSKHGAALRHLPSGYPQVNQAWMWGALLAVNLAGWLHQLTATPLPDGRLAGHGVRDGQAMIETLRHTLIRVPARLIHHAGTLTLRLPPGHHLLHTVLARIRALPTT